MIVVLLPAMAGAARYRIDFETPDLDQLSQLVIDPYVDQASGLSFQTHVAQFGLPGHVGLVLNRDTVACVTSTKAAGSPRLVPVSLADQKLGTGFVSGGRVGDSNFSIRMTFPRAPDGFRFPEFQHSDGSWDNRARLSV